MAIKNADSVRNAMLEGIRTTWGATPKLHFYSGSVPADEGVAIAGQLKLLEVTIAPAAASAGVMDMIGGSGTVTGTGTAAAATGTATTFYRVYNSGNTTCYEQGTITVTGGGGDMTIDNTSIAQNQSVDVGPWTKTAPGG